MPSLLRPARIALLAGLFVIAPQLARAQEAAEQQESQPTVQELQRRVDILAEEIDKLRSGEPQQEVSPERARSLGLGTSAASVYRRTRGVSIAGYGEMLYENFARQNQAGTPVNQGTTLDFLRAVFYFGYRFDEKFLFNSEIELEHANEIGVEFAYIDYLAHPSLTVRGGMVLLPMGLTNEFHEPPAFLSAKRPETESRIIPSTWRENGFGLVGSAGKFSYRAYVVNGLNAAGFTADGIRNGRQKGARAKAQDVAFVGRADVTPIPGTTFGGSYYVGNSSQDELTAGGQPIGVRTRIGEVHGLVQMRGIDVRGLYARTHLDDAAGLNTALNLTGTAGVAEVMEGGYIQAGYNVLSHFTERSSLLPFYRFEDINTQAKMPAGFAANPATDRRYHTVGVQFLPISSVTIKTDYQWIRNEANTGLSQFNIALGYNF
jgi:hypothetical protein